MLPPLHPPWTPPPPPPRTPTKRAHLEQQGTCAFFGGVQLYIRPINKDVRPGQTAHLPVDDRLRGWRGWRGWPASRRSLHGRLVHSSGQKDPKASVCLVPIHHLQQQPRSFSCCSFFTGKCANLLCTIFFEHFIHFFFFFLLHMLVWWVYAVCL